MTVFFPPPSKKILFCFEPDCIPTVVRGRVGLNQIASFLSFVDSFYLRAISVTCHVGWWCVTYVTRDVKYATSPPIVTTLQYKNVNRNHFCTRLTDVGSLSRNVADFIIALWVKVAEVCLQLGQRLQQSTDTCVIYTGFVKQNDRRCHQRWRMGSNDDGNGINFWCGLQQWGLSTHCASSP